MKDLLPEDIRIFIRDRYLAGVSDAEAKYRFNSGDEDALTGALGQALATADSVTLGSRNGMHFSFRIEHYKVRGRGADAPEKKFGTDGIFQIEIFDAAGRSIRKKGLPFQAKKNWKTSDPSLVKQASTMRDNLGSGVVINYGPHGYDACSIQDVIETKGRRKTLVEQDLLKPLGQLLANEFLNCEIGQIGLSYDPEREDFKTASGPFVPREVISTIVEKLPS